MEGNEETGPGLNFSSTNDGIPDISDLPSTMRSPVKHKKTVESCNISNGEFPLPQAESTSLNTNSTASTEPPQEIQSILDVTELTMPYDPAKWAHLSSMSDENFGSVDIFDDIFKFGKKNNKFLVQDPEILKSVSNNHFEIRRNEKKVYIYDYSTYGTYLNFVLIGKGKSRELDHTDKISILNKDLKAFTFMRLDKAYQPNDSTKDYLKSFCNYMVPENDEITVKKPKPTVTGSKSSKIPKPNGLNISYQNGDGIPDISDIRPTRNPVKHSSCNYTVPENDQSSVTKSKPSKVKKSRKITEISPESKSIRKTRSSLKNRSKLGNDVDPENVILTKRLRK